MTGRRSFIALTGAAGLVALSGCGSSSGVTRSKNPFLDDVTVSGFRVNASGAGNVIGDFVPSVGTARIANAMETGLNANLAGVGRGPQKIVLTVKVEFVSLAKTFLGETYAQTSISWSGPSGFVIAKLRSEANGSKTGTANGELQRLVAAYVSDMRDLLRES